MSTKTDYFEYVLDGKGGYKPVEDTKSPLKESLGYRLITLILSIKIW